MEECFEGEEEDEEEEKNQDEDEEPEILLADEPIDVPAAGIAPIDKSKKSTSYNASEPVSASAALLLRLIQEQETLVEPNANGFKALDNILRVCEE